ncbi:MAG: HlyD family efflux transporter periplasmic adaptor subunit [Lentisphaeria bacterium]|nr:HlyD family efflux transporter periplasmic adaptor subunit [Lentisphaeria bacterium]
MSKKTKKIWWWAIILLFVAGLVFWYSRATRSFSGKQVSRELYTAVQEGPLVINLLESGTIKPREQLIIKSKVEGRATILFLIPEGTRVHQGDLLVELDTSSIQDNKVNQEITVQNAEASYVQAKENLEVVRNQAKANIEKAELTLRFAKEDLKKYQEGEYPKVYKEYEGRITLAEEELQRAKDKLEWSKKLFSEKYLSETEMRSDQLACQRYELELQTARANLDLLKDYTYKRQIDEMESNVSQSTMALERTQRSSRADVVQAEAQLLARELELNRQKQKLEKFNEQIGNSKILAPADGLVIYATSAKGNWRGNTEPLTEGQEVFERQELIYLPTAETFIAEIKVHETNLKKVYTGLPARLRIDALPNQVFQGRIIKIAPLPDASSMFMNPDLKLYNTTVEVDGDSKALKSGMNCEAEIIIEQHAKALYIPVQSVVHMEGKSVAFVKNPLGHAEAREIEIGEDNNRMVHVRKGLQAGEEVLLTPPLHEAVSLRSNEALMDAEIPKRDQEAPAADKEETPANGRRQKLTPEQMKKLQERMANMSDEEKAELRKRRQPRQQNAQ